MPVNETLELEARLHEDGVRLEAVIVNALYPARFTAEEARRMAAPDGRLPAGARAGLRTALGEHEHARVQRGQLRRLRRSLEAPVGTLPFVFEPELGPMELERLSRDLEEAL
jgi:hypothetical protein